jgi:peptidoglycan pentaglycine glycine transferase (the first glycine)
MKVEICTNKPQWIQPVTGSFLQSWEWGEFQREFGRDPLRIQVKEAKRHTALAQLQGLTYNLRGGMKYLYVPKHQASSIQGHDALFSYLKKNGYAFARIEAMNKLDWSKTSPSVKKVKNRQPKQTMILSLLKKEDELLANMHQKTRYNIRLAEKKGISIKKEKNIDVFWDLNKETTMRDEFKSHPKKYYEKMLELNMAHQFTAYFEGEAIAAVLCIGYGNTFTYLHGASSNKHRNVMAPYALQWHAIRFAKERNFKHYDFWGVSPKKEGDTCSHGFCWDKNDKWSGVTRFKAGFGGRYESYPQAVDIVVSPTVYIIYKFGYALRKFL